MELFRRNATGNQTERVVALALLSSLIIATLALPGCGQKAPTGSVSGTVKVSGSTTVLPLSQEAATEFTDENPGANVEVQGGGSSVGISQLAEGIVDIGNSSRELKGEEAGKGLVDHRIAFDIIAIVANPSLPIDDLTSTQVKDIFTGRVTDWKEVGGPDGEIVVVVRDQASGTREMFDEKALGSTKDHPVESTASAIECASNGVVRETVGTTKGAIGYLSFGYINKLVKPVSYGGVPPDLENAKSGAYPMARFLHMFTKGEARGAARSYIDFVLSDKFQNDVVALEYIPVKQVVGR